MQSISPEDILKFLEENPGFFLKYPEQLEKSGLMEEQDISSKILNIRNRLFEKMREDRQNLLNALEESIKTVRNNEKIEDDFDMLENFVHEVAHSLEVDHGMFIYDDSLINEFRGKRRRLGHLLAAEGYHINPRLYNFTEYNRKFDNFLANEVGYPTLLTLTMGLFVSPYGATSIQEYFANGFEKYFLDNPRIVRSISPILYRKIEEIVNEDA